MLCGPYQLPFHAGLQYAREAHCHFPDIFSETATLDGLQAIPLLVGGAIPLLIIFPASAPRILSSIASVSAPKGWRETFTPSAVFLLLLHEIYYLKGNFAPHMAWDDPSPINYHTSIYSGLHTSATKASAW